MHIWLLQTDTLGNWFTPLKKIISDLELNKKLNNLRDETPPNDSQVKFLSKELATSPIVGNNQPLLKEVGLPHNPFPLK